MWIRTFNAKALVITTAISTAAVVAAQNDPASGVETVATFASAAPTENIAQGADGAIYVTGIDDRVIWKVSGANVERFASLPSNAAVLGIAADGDGVVVTAWQRRWTGPKVDFSDLGSLVIALDKTGNPTKTIAGEPGSAFNGIAPLGRGLFLIADSNASVLWQADLNRGTITRWLSDPGLGSPNADQTPKGPNGVKVHNRVAYVSVSGRRGIYRIAMDANNRPAGAPTLFAEGFGADDFDIAMDGALYAPSGAAMYRVSADGMVTTLLEKIPGGAASLVSGDGRWLYWPTRGGTAPQRLLRIALP